MFEGKRILVTGSCGSVGSELVRQLLTFAAYQPEEVVGIDNNETALFFQDQEWLAEGRARFFVADVRDREEIFKRFRGIDIVFHAAALKHVVLCERSPEQAVQTNIHGVQNIIAAALEHELEKVIFTSSDKAVNPTNVMGTSKLMGERLMTAANSEKRGAGPIFASTRFGNVLGSSGSVVPIFRNQVIAGGPVTVTDEQMSRFVMSLSEAVKMVIDSAVLARGGEVFITKMPVVRIMDLAHAVIQALAPEREIPIEIIGTKPGEKLYEELMSTEETRRSVELSHYFSVLPAFRGIYNDIHYDYDELVSDSVSDPYVSAEQPPMAVADIVQILQQQGLLDHQDSGLRRRYWPGDKEQSVAN